MVEVLYIHPFSQLNRNDIIPMGIMGLMNSLNCRKLGKMYYEVNNSDILNTKIVVMDIHWYHSMKSAADLALRCKRVNPSAKIIVGGYTATIFAEFILGNFKVDYVIKGDAEYPFILLTKAIIENLGTTMIPNVCSNKQNNEITYSISQKDFDNLDNISLDWFPTLKRKIVYYQSSSFLSFIYPWIPIYRGCKYSCDYCLGSNTYQYKLTGRALVWRSSESVVQDLIRLNNDRNIKTIYIFHDFIDVLGEDYAKKVLSRKYNFSLCYEFYNLPSFPILNQMIECFPGSTFLLPTTSNHANLPKQFEIIKLEKIFKILKKGKCHARLLVSINSLRKTKEQFYLNVILSLRRKYSFSMYLFENLFLPMTPKPNRDKIKLYNEYQEFFKRSSTETLGNSVRRNVIQFSTNYMPALLFFLEILQTEYIYIICLLSGIGRNAQRYPKPLVIK